MLGNGVCLFQLEGEAITELVAVDLKGNWCISKLLAAAKNCVAIVEDEVAVTVVDGTAHAFSGELGKWDSVPTSVTPQVSKDIVMIVAPDFLAVFSSATGKWAVAQTTKKHVTKRSPPNRLRATVAGDPPNTTVHVGRERTGNVSLTSGCDAHPGNS